VVIDGSMGEGGGQVLRASVALAALMSRSLRVRNIRAARANPGLRAQHLSGVTAVAAITGAILTGATVASRELCMTVHSPECPPQNPNAPLRVTTRTAGSCALVLQAALPVVLKYMTSGPALVLTGGTIAMAAPHADYVQRVLCPNLNHFGIELDYLVERHGFFPRGGALVNVSVGKSSRLHELDDTGMVALKPISWITRGKILDVCGRVVIAGKVADEAGVTMVATARKLIRARLRKEQGYEGDVTITMDRLTKDIHTGDCCAITVWARVNALGDDGIPSITVLGASGLLERRATPASTAQGASDELCDALETGACVDSHMADQVIMYVLILRGLRRCYWGVLSF
jgi:RNA 3'-terminal phosphate cyclase (ATP)